MDNADTELERSDESIRHTFREPTAEQQFQQQLVYTKFLTRSAGYILVIFDMCNLNLNLSSLLSILL